MNPVTHHPGEEFLWDYHRGALPVGLSLVVTAHARGCAHCRESLRLLDAVGGALLEAAEPVQMEATALDLALARIERPEPSKSLTSGSEPAVTPSRRSRPAFLRGFDLPEGVAEAVTGRSFSAPGVWTAAIRLDGAPKNSRTYLMHVRAGMTMPIHSHTGREATLVLTGAFHDATGEYRAGDFILNEDDVTHAPAITEDCLCLISQDAPIRPQDWLGRCLQPFAGI
jgi:putative transcriptional regulator